MTEKFFSDFKLSFGKLSSSKVLFKAMKNTDTCIEMYYAYFHDKELSDEAVRDLAIYIYCMHIIIKIIYIYI